MPAPSVACAAAMGLAKPWRTYRCWRGLLLLLGARGGQIKGPGGAKGHGHLARLQLATRWNGIELCGGSGACRKSNPGVQAHALSKEYSLEPFVLH